MKEFDTLGDGDDGIESSIPTRQPRAGISPVANTGGATVWVNGLRRSARLRPTIGSLYKHGRRRSARFFATLNLRGIYSNGTNSQINYKNSTCTMPYVESVVGLVPFL
jgi:hypothetical protein